MYLADTLSRAILPSTDQTRTAQETEILCAVDFAAISQPQLQEVAEHTAADPTSATIRDLIQKGWPEGKALVPAEALPYFLVRDELSFNSGIIWRGERCAIPSSLRQKIKRRLHVTHMGRNTLLRRARDVVYWPGLSADLKDELTRCDIYMSHQDEQPKEPITQSELPTRPWEVVAADIFTLRGRDYLCAVDYYSSFFEVDTLTGKTAGDVIAVLRRHFARYGIPEVVVSDNNPFGAQEFVKFAKDLRFKSVTTSPRYPQANGKAENAVKIAKRLLLRAYESNTNANVALLEWRNMPMEGCLASPAQLMFGRQTRTLLPAAPQLLTSAAPSPEEAQQALGQAKARQALSYNNGAKALTPLQVGDVVRVRAEQGSWIRGSVKGHAETPNSYQVALESGSELRRNRRHLRKSAERFQPQSHVPQPESPVPLEAVPVSPQLPKDPRPPELLPGPVQPTNEAGRAVLTTTRSGRAVKIPPYLRDYC